LKSLLRRKARHALKAFVARRQAKRTSSECTICGVSSRDRLGQMRRTKTASFRREWDAGHRLQITIFSWNYRSDGKIRLFSATCCAGWAQKVARETCRRPGQKLQYCEHLMGSDTAVLNYSLQIAIYGFVLLGNNACARS